MRIQDYLLFFNDEAEAGVVASRAILATPVAEWDQLLGAHPDWIRYGTLEALLRVANEELDRLPARSLSLAQFVLRAADRLLTPFKNDFLPAQIRGTAWKEMASALHALQKFEDAGKAAAAAVRTFEEHPVLVVDRAVARFVQAQVWHEQQRTTEAVAALDEAVEVFAEHAQAQRYLYALEFLGIIVFDQGQYEAARDVFIRAFSEAERLQDDRERARLLNNLGQCATHLGHLGEATDYLTRAFDAFDAQKMYLEVSRAVWGIARIAVRHEQFETAFRTLQDVYAEFLRRALVPQAGRVLVELTAVVARLGGDLPRAKVLCAQFVTAITPYDLREDIRRAAEYLRTQPQRVSSPEELETVLSPVRDFFVTSLGNSSAAFVLPDALTA